MKKKLNIDIIQSELRGGSAFFPGYKSDHTSRSSAQSPNSQTIAQSSPEPKIDTANRSAPPLPTKKQKKIVVSTSALQGVPPPVPRTEPRPAPRTDPLVPKVKRAMKQRQPFDIYEDQYVRLKQIADAERGFVNGRGMSHMVREAIDAYLAAQEPRNKK